MDADDYAVTTNGTCSGTATGGCRRLDANADGVVNSADRTAIAAYLATLDSDTELQRVPAATHSRRGNLFAHQGLVLDPEIGSYQNRARQYAPGAKRFMQRDRLFDRRLVNFYSYVLARPTRYRDPSGMSTDEGATQLCREKEIPGGPGVGETFCDGTGGFYIICVILA
ncbi:MAG: hypothetical protein H6816_13540 [Phycisphaerales bacterium]|nr:hypothetical protein [Phycisphaerales bacterium]